MSSGESPEAVLGPIGEAWARALELSWEANRQGNVPVGAVLTGPTGQVVATGRSRYGEREGPPGHLAGGNLAHAEISALAGLSPGAYLGHTLYTTLEPCLLCSAASVHAHIGTIRFAAPAPLWEGLDGLPGLNPQVARWWPRREGPIGGPLRAWTLLLAMTWHLRTNPSSQAVCAYERSDPAALAVARRAVAEGLPRARDTLADALRSVWHLIGPETPLATRGPLAAPAPELGSRGLPRGGPPRPTPLLEAYLAARRRPAPWFTIPGHKGRIGILDPRLAVAVDADRPLFGGLDTPKLAVGVLDRAEQLAAEHYGADWCRFSVGGSAQANQALCLALGRPGDLVIVSRSLHRSLLLGLILAGLEPRWLPTRSDEATGLPIGTSPVDLREALAANPDAQAVLLTEPGYLGTLSDLPQLVALAHRAGMPVLVDQAWGAHFGFHPDLPAHALSAGADALVTSIHKLLPGHSQASLVCARLERMDRGRLERAFQATHTTSPAGSILASIDGTLGLMETKGAELLEPALQLVRGARRSLARELPGVGLPDETNLHRIGPAPFDPLKLVIQLAPIGADGVAVETALLERGLALEFADRDTLVPVVTIADDQRTVGEVIGAVVAAVKSTGFGSARRRAPAASWQVRPTVAMSPRAAFFAAHERVPAGLAIGRTAAELVAPYPPGIPVLSFGEVITAPLLEALWAAAASGVRIAYAADPNLETLEVVRN
jgi:arginine decarboxylase